MRAMILAAGLGKRMRSLTEKTAKPLLTINQKPLIVYHIENMAKAGIVEIIINCHHKAKKLVSCLGNGKNWHVRITYSHEKKLLGTGKGIENCLGWLGGGPFLVVNGDIWTDFPYSSLPKTIAKSAYIIMVNNPSENPTGDFMLVNGDIINGDKNALTYSGIGLYTSGFFTDNAPPISSLATLIRKSAHMGLVTGSHFTGTWMDVGTPERLEKTRKIVAKKENIS